MQAKERNEECRKKLRTRTLGRQEMDGPHKNGSRKNNNKKYVTEWMLSAVFIDLSVPHFASKINVMKNFLLLDGGFVTGII